MIDKVKAAIENVRPDLQMDGGDIEFIKMEGSDVFVRLKGACAGCPMSQMTLKNGVERYVRSIVDPSINIVSEN
jgi:Fe-S cluster biogenesis protein NfuA